MQILPNPTIVALQIVPFLVTLLGLYFLIFKPMLGYLSGREDAISGAQHRAKDLRKQLGERVADYEQRSAAARAELQAMRAQRRAAALGEAQGVIAAARVEVEAQTTAAVGQLGAQAAQARVELQASSAALGARVAGQVLGRPLAGLVS
jgi:F-type H+-transporting ATPase subunit b